MSLQVGQVYKTFGGSHVQYLGESAGDRRVRVIVDNSTGGRNLGVIYGLKDHEQLKSVWRIERRLMPPDVIFAPKFLEELCL